MGTICTLTTFTEDRKTSIARVEEYVQILEESEKELSTWIDDSALSQLNRHPRGRPFRLGESLCPLFEKVFDWSRETGSAFDPAIASLMETQQLSAAMKSDVSILRDARRVFGLEHLQFDASSCEVVRRREVRIDPGAFGKGEAMDRVLRHAHSQAETSLLVDFGGQVLVLGSPPDRQVWSVDLSHPLDRSRAFLQLELDSGSLATSGGSERDSIIDDKRIGHILDPRNGLPVSLPGAVTVWHPTALAADILSTALYVMGPSAGLDWAESRGIAACFLLLSGDPESEVVIIQATTAFQKRFF